MFFLYGDGFGHPVGDAVAGFAECDGVGVFVTHDAFPVEVAVLALAFAWWGECNDGAGAGGDGPDVGHAGNADGE